MNVVVNDSRTQGKELIYKENLWTGQRKISFDGQEAKKKTRKQFLLQTDEGEVEFNVKGNFLAGITVQSPCFAEPVEVCRKFTPLEYIFAILAFVMGVACGLLGGWAGGVIGGALQGCAYGVIAGLFFVLVVYAVMGIERKWLRYLVCAELVLVCAGLAFFAGYGFALLRIATA